MQTFSRAAWPVLLLPFLAASSSFQGVEGISVGVTRLTLGMKQDSVIALLAGYEVEGGFVFFRTGDRQRVVVASILFDAGRLAGVRRKWEPEDQQQAVPFADALYGALNQFVTEHRQQCWISVGSNARPVRQCARMKVMGTLYICVCGKRRGPSPWGSRSLSVVLGITSSNPPSS
jgi:hypothetical protein